MMTNERGNLNRTVSLIIHVKCHDALRKRSALLTTDNELKLMAAAAMMGLSSRPNAG